MWKWQAVAFAGGRVFGGSMPTEKRTSVSVAERWRAAARRRQRPRVRRRYATDGGDSAAKRSSVPPDWRICAQANHGSTYRGAVICEERSEAIPIDVMGIASPRFREGRNDSGWPPAARLHNGMASSVSK